MTTLALSSLPSAIILTQYPAAAAFPQITPWRRILAVEPDIAALNAGSLLLTKANYCVTRASTERELFSLRTKAVALAILSDRLGRRLLSSVAETVRKQWPRARILILGQAAPMLEDHLYDEQLHRSSDPQQVLADLERLYHGMWNERSDTLDWDATRSALCLIRPPISESDPTKAVPRSSTEDRILRETPSDIRVAGTRGN
jgi:hypothetical protein